MLSTLAAEALLVLGVFLGAGVLVSCTYALNWRRRPTLRHVITWPFVLGAMFAGELASGHTLPDGRSSLRQPRPRSVSPLGPDEILRDSADALASDWAAVGDDLRVALSQVSQEFLDDRLDPTGRLRMRVHAALLSDGVLPDPDGFVALAEAEPDLPHLVLDRCEQVQRDRFRSQWEALSARPRRRR